MSDPLEAVLACLERITRLDPTLRAFVEVDAGGAIDAANRSALRWRAGRPLSPVDGMPVGIKANIAVAGMRWHAGIAAYRERRATRDAAVVERLRAGGAVLLGLLNMDEAALGGTTDNPAFGRTQNPRRPGYSAGGSSGGAGAAVAAGLCVAALGTDTLGSVRIPAAYCGVFGHKPSAGLLPMQGVVPLAPQFDTVGLVTGTAEDAAALLAWLTQSHAAPGFASECSIGVLETSGQVDVMPQQEAALQHAAEAAALAGFRVARIRLADLDYAKIRRAALLVIEVAAAQVHAEALALDPDGFSRGLRAMLAYGAAQPAARVDDARRLLAAASALVLEAFRPYTAVLAPTTPQPACAFDTPAPRNQADLTALANIAGLAATAFPMGEDQDGLPLSVQAMAARDEPCLAIAAALGRRAREASPSVRSSE